MAVTRGDGGWARMKRVKYKTETRLHHGLDYRVHRCWIIKMDT